MKAAALALCGALLAGACPAATFAPPPPPRIDWQQRPGATLPPELGFTGADGRALRLGDAFDGVRPVVLVLGRWRCPNLCGLAMQGVLEALADTGLPGDAVRVLGVGIDPDETAADAAGRERAARAYADWLAAARRTTPPELRLVVGAPAAVDLLTRRVGFEAARTPGARGAPADWAHPLGLVVVTPAGRVSRTLFGVRYDATALRLALVEAASGRIGGLTDRLLLRCAHLDPALGRLDTAVMAALRALGLVGAATLAAWIWRHRRLARGARR